MVDPDDFEDEVESALDQASGGDSGGGGTAESAREAAEEIVEAEGIESSDYIVFQSKMDKRGFSRQETKDVWDELRSEQIIPSPNDHEDSNVTENEPEPPELGNVDPADVKELHLFVVEGCPACSKAKEQMSDVIENGDVTLQNIDESDDAADLALEWEIQQAPLLVAEMEDGSIERL